MPPVWFLLALLPILGGAERFNCRGRILGAYYADAKSGCKAFHVCVRVAGGGVRDFRFFCPPGTLFHQEAQTCTDWGDDDPLACPADLYDGFDTKKVSSPANREEEPEFGLQRAETGDRRLQNNAVLSGPASDLRAAHSSDFFSGQRNRGRDDEPVPPAPSSQPRQSFRRPTTPRSSPSTTTLFTTPAPPPNVYQEPKQTYEQASKRKLVRKRPFYHSTTASPTTYENTPPSRPVSEQPQAFNRRFNPQNRQSSPAPVNYVPQVNTAPPANVPPEYKDEYVEVSRVTPKAGRLFQSSQSPAPFSPSSPTPNKKDNLVEVYNFDAQSTPGYNAQSNRNNENKNFKVRNNFSVQDIPTPRDNSDYFRAKNVNVESNGARGTSATVDTRVTTASYKNFNSVSYEPEKNNFVQYNGGKQNYYTAPSSTPTTTTVYTTSRTNPSQNFNTVAYNTNNAFNTQSSNYDANEDDGQYRLPHGEDDGQYRPELYEKELLSGAHSLNIAASGNRLPEDQKPIAKQTPTKNVQQPRPFRPAPTPANNPAPTTRTTEPPKTINPQRTFDYYQPYTTTSRPASEPVFEFGQVQNNAPSTTSAPRTPEPRPQTRAPVQTKAPQTRPTPAQTRPPAPSPPTLSPSKASKAPPPPQYSKPANKKEDASYDYAYYDSDTGFSEYDHIEEFGKTKTKV